MDDHVVPIVFSSVPNDPTHVFAQKCVKGMRTDDPLHSSTCSATVLSASFSSGDPTDLKLDA